METKVNKNSVLLKNTLLIAAAIIVAGAAYYLSKQYMAKKEADLILKFQAKTEQMVSVVVASSDIVEGTVVNASNLSVAEIAAEHAPLDVITPDGFEKIKEHTALINIPKGKPIMPSYISSVLAERFSDLLENGQRAITFSVDTLNSSNSMLKPGDKVDLFLLVESKGVTGVSSEKELISLLQNVTVLATGKNTKVPLPNQEVDTTEQQYETLTIAVIPQDAQKILLAKDSGSIVTLLRNRADLRQLPASVLNYAALKNNGNQVEYFTGTIAEAGVLKSQLQPVHTITAPSELPLQCWKN